MFGTFSVYYIISERIPYHKPTLFIIITNNGFIKSWHTLCSIYNNKDLKNSVPLEIGVRGATCIKTATVKLKLLSIGINTSYNQITEHRHNYVNFLTNNIN